ncbi:hypothetical protein ACFQ10_25280 [Streptomyces indonesiensis]
MRLDPLDAAEGRLLLAALAGPGRVAAEPDAADRIVARCDGLPLALRICAARLAAYPQWRLAHLADRLAPAERRLGELSLGSLDVRATLSRCHARLAPTARYAFRVLAYRDGDSAFTARQAAVELRWPEGRAEDVLESISEVRLLDIIADGDQLRYRYRPLVWLFAREQRGRGPGPQSPPGGGTG